MNNNSIKFKLSTSQNIAMQIAGILQEYSGKEIVLFCVGNAKVWYDCFAPIVADLLRLEASSDFYIYGGINYPITAENIGVYIDFVKAKHPNACVIVVDNCLTLDVQQSGDVQIAKRSTNIAGLAGGFLFGDISLLLKTCPTSNSFMFLKHLQVLLPQIVIGLRQAIDKTTLTNLLYSKDKQTQSNTMFICKK